MQKAFFLKKITSIGLFTRKGEYSTENALLMA